MDPVHKFENVSLKVSVGGTFVDCRIYEESKMLTNVEVSSLARLQRRLSQSQQIKGQREKARQTMLFQLNFVSKRASVHVCQMFAQSCWKKSRNKYLLVVVRVNLLSMSKPVEVALHVIVHLCLHLVLLVHPPAKKLPIKK